MQLLNVGFWVFDKSSYIVLPKLSCLGHAKRLMSETFQKICYDATRIQRKKMRTLKSRNALAQRLIKII